MANTTPKKEVLILELIDRENSGYVLEGSQEAGHPIYLNGPAWERIVPTSHVMVDGAPRKIRHIQGAPTYFVDEQDKMGLKYEPLRDDIKFPSGTSQFTVVREGRTIAMYDYLKVCEFNLHAPNKPGDLNVRFREIRTEEIAKIDVSILKYKKQARDTVNELYTETPTGEYTYELDRVNMLVQFFGIIGQDTDSEKLMAINAIAESDPVRFVHTIADKATEYRSNINEAIQLGVLSMDGPGASFRSTGTVFLKFKKKEKEAQYEELIRHFLYPEGAINYQALRIDLDAARRKLADIQ